MRVVLDTNVLISALLWKKKLDPIYDLINKREATLCFSEATLEEFRRVLHYSHILAKAQEEELDVDRIFKTITSNSIKVYPKRIPRVIQEDPSDNEFLACAISSGASFIISGDRHLLKLKEFQGIPIVSPKKFLESLRE